MGDIRPCVLAQSSATRCVSCRPNAGYCWRLVDALLTKNIPIWFADRAYHADLRLPVISAGKLPVFIVCKSLAQNQSACFAVQRVDASGTTTLEKYCVATDDVRTSGINRVFIVFAGFVKPETFSALHHCVLLSGRRPISRHFSGAAPRTLRCCFCHAFANQVGGEIHHLAIIGLRNNRESS